MYEFDMVTHTGSELVLGVSHASHPKGQSLRALRLSRERVPSGASKQGVFERYRKKNLKVDA